jgi:hypothetical protein
MSRQAASGMDENVCGEIGDLSASQQSPSFSTRRGRREVTCVFVLPIWAQAAIQTQYNASLFTTCWSILWTYVIIPSLHDRGHVYLM